MDKEPTGKDEILKALAKLLRVKNLVILILVAVVCVMALNEMIVPSIITTAFTAAIGFLFPSSSDN